MLYPYGNSVRQKVITRGRVEIPPIPPFVYACDYVCIVVLKGKYFGLDEDAYERQITDECLTRSAHQLPEHGTYQSQTLYTPYTVKMGQLTLYR